MSGMSHNESLAAAGGGAAAATGVPPKAAWPSPVAEADTAAKGSNACSGGTEGAEWVVEALGSAEANGSNGTVPTEAAGNDGALGAVF